MTDLLEQRLSIALRRAGVAPTQEALNEAYAQMGLGSPPAEPAAAKPIADAQPAGGDYVDVAQGAFARQMATGLKFGQIVEGAVDKVTAPGIGAEIQDAALPGLLPPALSEIARIALWVAKPKIVSRARESIQGYFEGVGSAPENQPDPNRSQFGNDVAAGFGSAAGFALGQAVPAIATGGMSTGAQAAIAAGQGALLSFTDAYYEARGAGRQDAEAYSYALVQALGGASEGVGTLFPIPALGKVAGLLAKGNAATSGALSSGLSGLVVGAVKGGVKEMGQEGGQGLYEEAVRRWFQMNPEDARTWSEVVSDVAMRQALPAGPLGAIFGAIDTEAQGYLAADKNTARVERDGLTSVPGVPLPGPAAQEAPGSSQAEDVSQVQPDAQEQSQRSRRGQPGDPFYKRLRADENNAIQEEVEAPAELSALADAVSKRGHRLRFVRTAEGGTFRGAFDASSGDIAVNVNRPNEAIEYTVGHELTHALKARYGGAHQEMVDAIRAADPDGLALLEGEAQDRNAGIGPDLTSEEGAAYYVEEVLGPWMRAAVRDPAKLESIARDNRTTFRKIVESVLDVINTFAGTKFNTYREQVRAVLGETGVIGRKMAPAKAARLAQQISGIMDTMQPEIRQLPEMAQAPTQELAPSVQGPERAQSEDGDVYSRSKTAEPTRRELFTRRFIDSFQALEADVRKRFNVKDSTYIGVKGKELQDPLLGVRQERGIVGRELAGLHTKYRDPVVNTMKGAGISSAEVDDVLYAMAAPKRNAYLSKINPDADASVRDSLSGMSDAEAAEILKRWKADKRWPAMVKITDAVHAMNRSDLERRVSAGLIEREYADSLAAAFGDTYVPLRTDEIHGVSGQGRGKSSIRGTEFRHATGRRTRADSPLVFSMLQAELGARRSVRNSEVYERVAKYVEAAKDPSLGFVTPIKVEQVNDDGDVYETSVHRYFTEPSVVQRVVDGEKTNVVRDVFAPGKLNDPNVLLFKRNGEQWAVVFSPQAVDIAAALKNDKIDKLPAILGKLPQYSQWIKRAVSQHNPVFGVFNGLFRDPISTFGRQWSERGLGFSIDVMRDIGKMALDIKNEGPWSKAYRETGGFMPPGGNFDFESTSKDIEAFLSRGELRQAASRIWSHVDAFNEVMENQARLAVFKNMVERGYSKEQASLAAKEANTNFGTRGEWAPMLDALYAFWGANVAGSRGFWLTMKGKNFKQLAGSVVASTAALDILNRMMSGEDDTGENVYDKIPESEKAGNIIIMRGPGSRGYISIPLPPGGLAYLFNIGRFASEAAWGPSTPTVAGSKLLGNAITNANPFGANIVGEGDTFSFSSSGVLQMGAPTVVDPIVQALTNADWRGKPIHPENLPFGAQRPDSQLYYGSRTSKLLATSTAWLNDLFDTDDSGKSDIEALDVSPATIQHLVSGYLPGVWQEALRVGKLMEKSTDPDMSVEVRDIPLVSRLWRSGNPYQIDMDFRSRTAEIVAAKARYDELRKAGEYKRALAWRSANIDLFREIGSMRVAERVLSKIPNSPEGESRRREAKAAFLSRNRALSRNTQL